MPTLREAFQRLRHASHGQKMTLLLGVLAFAILASLIFG